MAVKRTCSRSVHLRINPDLFTAVIIKWFQVTFRKAHVASGGHFDVQLKTIYGQVHTACTLYHLAGIFNNTEYVSTFDDVL